MACHRTGCSLGFNPFPKNLLAKRCLLDANDFGLKCRLTDIWIKIINITFLPNIGFTAVSAQCAGGPSLNKVSNAIHLRFDL
jgi:hypothetical protein